MEGEFRGVVLPLSSLHLALQEPANGRIIALHTNRKKVLGDSIEISLSSVVAELGMGKENGR